MSLIDAYSRRARLAPAALAVAPELALGIALVPALPGVSRLWALVAIGVLPYVALKSRQAGNRVQEALWKAWGGKPTTRRLRYQGAPNPSEVERLHSAVELLLGGEAVPKATEEQADSAAADLEYDSAVRRVIGLVRTERRFPLVAEENANYGFCRNLYGLKKIGVGGAVASIFVSLAAGVLLEATHHVAKGAALLLPVLVSAVALYQWRTVTSDWVRLSAEAYADRLFEAAQVLARVCPRSG